MEGRRGMTSQIWSRGPGSTTGYSLLTAELPVPLLLLLASRTSRLASLFVNGSKPGSFGTLLVDLVTDVLPTLAACTTRS